MANTTYTSPQITTPTQKLAAYGLAANLLEHIPNLGLNLVSILVNAGVVSVTLDNPLPASHPPSFWNLS